MAPSLSTLFSFVLERFKNKNEETTPSFPHLPIFMGSLGSGSRKPPPCLVCSALPGLYQPVVEARRSPLFPSPNLFSDFSSPRSVLRGERQMVCSYRRKKPFLVKSEDVGHPKFYKCIYCGKEFTFYHIPKKSEGSTSVSTVSGEEEKEETCFHDHWKNNHRKFVKKHGRKKGQEAPPHIHCKDCENRFLTEQDLEDHKPFCNHGDKKHKKWLQNFVFN